jgi:hypothetical protein
VTSIEYQIELERTNGRIENTGATLPPQLTKGQRLKLPVGDGLVDAEVVEVTQLTSDEPPKWKLLARSWARRSNGDPTPKRSRPLGICGYPAREAGRRPSSLSDLADYTWRGVCWRN